MRSLKDILEIALTLCTLVLVGPLVYMLATESLSVWLVLPVLVSFPVEVFIIILLLIIHIEEADYDDQYVKMSADRYNKKR